MPWSIAVTFLLGLSSGLPLIAIGSTLQAWMKDLGTDLTIIGFFSLVGLPYTFKFLWAPLMDRYVPPFLGRRRGWILLTQLGLMASFSALAFVNPKEAPEWTAALALVTAFLSASQDIAIDAYRRELLPDAQLGLGSSMAVFGYRIGMLITGAGALFLADQIPWTQVYLCIAATLLIGSITVFFAPEPDAIHLAPRTLKEAVIEPFKEYFQRKGALEILAFILLYKIGDAMATSLTTPFVMELGYAKSEIASVAKTFGLFALIGGGIAGGVIMVKIGIERALILFGVMQALAILTMIPLLHSTHSLSLLAVTIASENLAMGMGTTAYTAFMASLTNKKFTATQYALLSSLMGVPRVILSAPSGFMAKNMGWQNFFLFCTLMAVPGMILFIKRHKTWATVEE